MSNASDICAARIIRTNSEGFRASIYDDKEPERVIEWIGEPTCGYGCRCRQWSEPFARAVLSLQLEEFEKPLILLPWYVGCNDARRSALLEIAFNDGDSGLIKRWPHLVAAVEQGNWQQAKAQCVPANPAQRSRYGRIGDILLTGIDQ